MSNSPTAPHLWHRLLDVLRCPLCGGALAPPGGVPASFETLRGVKSLGCADGHSFDVARQGYVGLLTGNTNAANAVTANVNAATPIPAVNEIKVEIKSLVDRINVTAITDGRKVSEDILLNASKTYTGQQSVRVSYYRGFTPDKLQVTLNGKQVTAPSAPAKGSTITFEINKDNAAQILQSGQIPSADAATAPATTNPAARTAPR